MIFKYFSSFGKIMLFLSFPFYSFGQWQKGVYQNFNKNDSSEIFKRIIFSDPYFIVTEYKMNPASFTSTKGGFIKFSGNKFSVELEFNSIFGKDSLKVLNGTFEVKENELLLTFQNGTKTNFTKRNPMLQELNGNFLMAGRVTEQGETRRRVDVPRKTMKVLIDGYFQWIAFNTETFEFSGTGGGTYTANKSGDYIERIDFFSKNASRVGAILPFSFNLKDMDWFHQGKSSAGEPIHEIWSKRVFK